MSGVRRQMALAVAIAALVVMAGCATGNSGERQTINVPTFQIKYAE
jgi:hypothetical protein